MKQSIPVPMKALYVAVAIVCLLLGIIGLILPMMPGVLFLAIALLLLGRVSSRFHRWSQGHPEIRRLRLRMAGMSGVGLGDRLKLAGWMTLELLVKGIASVIDAGKTLVRTARA